MRVLVNILLFVHVRVDVHGQLLNLSIICGTILCTQMKQLLQEIQSDILSVVYSLHSRNHTMIFSQGNHADKIVL